MGSLLSCFGAVAQEEPEQPELPVHGHCCSCFSFCFNGYTALFERGASHVVPLSAQTTTPSTFSCIDTDCSAIDTFCPPPRPLAFDDPLFSVQHDYVPPSLHSQDETEPLRDGCFKPCSETGTNDKNDGSKCLAKLHCSDLPSKCFSEKKNKQIRALFLSD